MDPWLLGALSFGSLLGLLLIGVPIAFAAAFVGIIGLLVVAGPATTLMYISHIPYSEVVFYSFILIPLFTIMGDFSAIGGVADGLFTGARRWVGKFPGGLGIATVMGAAGFGACCGSSVAASAALGRICIPEMRKQGYDDSLSSGIVAASANLSSMIPPSGLFIIYGLMTEQSVGKLLIAGILPGILIAFLFSTVIWWKAKTNPEIAPPLGETVSWREKFRSLKLLWGALVVIGVIILSAYTGIATITEAGIIGVFFTFLLAVFSRKLSVQNLFNALLQTAKTTSMILLIVAGVMIFTRFLAASGFANTLAAQLSSLAVPREVILLAIVVFYLFLGMFFDGISMLILTLPVLFPVIMGLGYDPIWFGVICVLMCETGLITPPVGINCYVVAATQRDIPLEKVFKGIWPFVVVNLIVLVILTVFPQIALFLPSMVKL